MEQLTSRKSCVCKWAVNKTLYVTQCLYSVNIYTRVLPCLCCSAFMLCARHSVCFWNLWPSGSLCNALTKGQNNVDICALLRSISSQIGLCLCVFIFGLYLYLGYLNRQKEIKWQGRVNEHTNPNYWGLCYCIWVYIYSPVRLCRE